MPGTLADAPERTENEYAHLIELFRERDRLPADDPRREVLRSELITGYLPVAHNIAHRFVHRGDSLDDLEQVATVGLIGAVDRFEPDRGIDFLSFAVPTITGEVRGTSRPLDDPDPAPDHPAAGRPVRGGERADPAPGPLPAPERASRAARHLPRGGHRGAAGPPDGLPLVAGRPAARTSVPAAPWSPRSATSTPASA